MKNVLLLVLPLISIILLSSCDPQVQIEWKVENLTNSNIEIVSQSLEQDEISYNSISPESIIILEDIWTIGTAKDEIANPTFYFTIMDVRNGNMENYNKDIFNLDNWEIRNIDDELAEFKLRVREEDF